MKRFILIAVLLTLWSGSLSAAPQHQTAQRTFTNQVTHSIVVTWTASISSGVLYRVYRATTSQTGPYTIVSDNLNALLYTERPGVNGAVSGTTYFYQVSAVDQTTFIESPVAMTSTGQNFVSARMP